MTGKRFGRLVVTKFAYTKYTKPRCARAMWYCNCDQKRDKIKQDYCQHNSIPLIIIPYTDIDDIDDYLLQKIFSKGV